MKKLIKRTGAALRNRVRSWADRLTSVNKTQAEVDALYRFMHKYIHDNERAPDLAAAQTASAFGFQWASLQDGEYMTRDPWFQNNVTRILCEQELMLPAAWFPGKTYSTAAAAVDAGPTGWQNWEPTSLQLTSTSHAWTLRVKRRRPFQ